MSLQSAADVPLLITSPNSSSERRITPSWTIDHLKTRLEPITGIPATCQRLHLKTGASQPIIAIESTDEESTQLANFPLQAYAEIHVHDTRPPSLRPTYTDVSTVPKYTLPPNTYAALPSTVLSYKRDHHLGRFDPSAPSLLAQQRAHILRDISERNIAVGKRCRLLPEDSDGRRGEVAFVGEVDGIPGVGVWVGVKLDEPVGKNDGRGPGGKRYFECQEACGVFVRGERVEVGEFGVLDELGEEMDEI